MTRIGSKKTLVILGVVLIATIVVWVGLFFLIQQAKIEALDLAPLREKSLVLTENNLRLNKEKVATIDKYFISSDSAIKLLELVESLGTKTGVRLVVGQAGETPAELKLNLSTEGSYSSTLKFLQALETLPYGERVERLELRKGEKLWQSVFVLKILKNNGNI